MGRPKGLKIIKKLSKKLIKNISLTTVSVARNLAEGLIIFEINFPIILSEATKKRIKDENNNVNRDSLQCGTP